MGGCCDDDVIASPEFSTNAAGVLTVMAFIDEEDFFISLSLLLDLTEEVARLGGALCEEPPPATIASAPFEECLR